LTHAATPPTPPAALLLGRPEFATDLADVAACVTGRRVLVTGAGGSVGWPLSETLRAVGPAELTLVDHHEHSLFSLERALGPSTATLHYELADIRDHARMARLFETRTPDVVFHLAAAKHVPYGERFPEGAVGTNVLALDELQRCARRTGTSTFVYPSSDKSVQPPSVYGATKRLAEALLQRTALELAATQPTARWTIVRYVNIIGTRGSVIETFTQQLLASRPLSVTDARMTRYWISMAEAVWCLLVAATAAASGTVVMPACGAAVPVLETAQRLAGWYRPEQVPYPIDCTGIRPGERLHEVLVSPNETAVEGPRAGLLTVQTRRAPSALAVLPDVLAELRTRTADGDRVGLADACRRAADALQ
jgi:FlaA1/EpsC-like NDP-sugar epimerase